MSNDISRYEALRALRDARVGWAVTAALAMRGAGAEWTIAVDIILTAGASDRTIRRLGKLLEEGEK